MRNALFSLLVALGLFGCKTLDEHNAHPAKVINFNADAKAEIAGLINNIMPGANVKLADDILSKDYRLFIQRASMTVDGNPVDGRITEMPRKFELFESNGGCFLVDSKTNKSYLLKKVDCQQM